MLKNGHQLKLDIWYIPRNNTVTFMLILNGFASSKSPYCLLVYCFFANTCGPVCCVD